MPLDTPTISVIGLGYIGLPTAAVFASRKFHVIGVDVNAQAVETINKGEVHIVEPDLDGVVRTAVQDGFLRATTVPEPADAFLIAVPTPFTGDGQHTPDLKYIEAAAKAIAPVLRAGNLVILESTSPVGATEKMADWLAAERADLTFPQTAGDGSDIRIAHCPERVLPGNVLRELVSNDRVIGGMTPRCAEAAIAIYAAFLEGEAFVTDARTAEMVKLTENSFRDVNIAFANELSVICDRLDINVWELVDLANRHPRVGILQPGPGVGGHCIAVDPWFIVSQAPDDARLIRQARETNDAKPGWVLEKIDAAVGRALARSPSRTAAGIRVALFGLSFKPNIDDLRESPALDIARAVADRHPGTVLIVEPHVGVLPGGMGRAELVDATTALKDADVAVMLVDHRLFQGLSPRDGTELVDTRGVWTRPGRTSMSGARA